MHPLHVQGDKDPIQGLCPPALDVLYPHKSPVSGMLWFRSDRHGCCYVTFAHLSFPPLLLFSFVGRMLGPPLPGPCLLLVRGGSFPWPFSRFASRFGGMRCALDVGACL
eukprot:scaffold598_cov318-Pavlova_lutheri.AAC.9